MEEFNLGEMLNFVVKCEEEQIQVRAESPDFEENQFQRYPEDSYDITMLSQPSKTTDGGAFAVHYEPVTYEGSYPTTILPFNSYSTKNKQRNNYGFESNFYESPQQNCNVSGVFGSLQNQHSPPQEVPAVVYKQEWDSQIQQQSLVTPSESIEFKIKCEAAPQVAEQPRRATKRTSNTKQLKTHTSDWNCVTCVRSFRSRKGMIQHNVQTHSGAKPHRCNICGKRFKDWNTMQQHRQRHLATNKPFKCDECPKQFFRASDLRRHVDLHHGIVRFSCSICNKAFDRADHVRNHELSHENGTVKHFRRHETR